MSVKNTRTTVLGLSLVAAIGIIVACTGQGTAKDKPKYVFKDGSGPNGAILTIDGKPFDQEQLMGDNKGDYAEALKRIYDLNLAGTGRLLLEVGYSEEAKKAAEKADEQIKKDNTLVQYDAAERKQLSHSIFGAIYKVTLDPSHPLSFGLGDSYYSLRTTSMRYDYMQDGWNVGTLRGNVKPLMGFAGYKANQTLSNTMVFGVEDKGRGEVIYLVDNPLFRSFWENGKMLFSNAVFVVGGM